MGVVVGLVFPRFQTPVGTPWVDAMRAKESLDVLKVALAGT